MDDKFYQLFEERFRGPQKEITERLRARYSDILQIAKRSGNSTAAIDYGCGRGEWVEFLQSQMWDATGVDSNMEMLQQAPPSLNLQCDDVIANLKKQPDNQFGLVSAFHLVEHLPIETLIIFIKESQRILAPGGILLLETPNPENINIATYRFYTDPTHIRPIPPELLSFIVSYAGLDSHTLRFNEQKPQPYYNDIATALFNLLRTSPDYCIMGIKSESNENTVTKYISQIFISQKNPDQLIDDLLEKISSKNKSYFFKKIFNFLRNK